MISNYQGLFVFSKLTDYTEISLPEILSVYKSQLLILIVAIKISHLEDELSQNSEQTQMEFGARAV